MLPYSYNCREKLKRLVLMSPTTVVRNYWHNYEKRYCFGSHKQCKTLLKDHMVSLKIISLYIYKD